jgi:cardiolipin synthase
LESGIRVFEWNGTMLHAKTAVADSHWARVGSTNLNLASWIGNYELDVAIEDEQFAQTMERMYREDLSHATEIILSPKRRLQQTSPLQRQRIRGSRGSSSRAAAGALRIANSIGAAITSQRVLGPAEAKMMGMTGALLLAIAVIAGIWPRVVAIPLALVTGWIAVTFLVKAWRLRRLGKNETPSQAKSRKKPFA